jgi:hypothetical protein
MQLAPVTLKLTAPLPDPPDVVRVIGVLIATLRVVFEIVNVAWASKNVNVTAADVAESNVASAAFVAVTEQEVEVEALS